MLALGSRASLPDDFISRNRFFQKADFLCICDIMAILKNQNTGRNAKHPLLEEKLRDCGGEPRIIIKLNMEGGETPPLQNTTLLRLSIMD